jgi:hypothetical protein
MAKKKRALNKQPRLLFAANLRKDVHVKKHSTHPEVHPKIIHSLEKWFTTKESHYLDRLDQAFVRWKVPKEDFNKIMADRLFINKVKVCLKDRPTAICYHRFNGIAAALQYLFTYPALEPALIDPFIYPDIVNSSEFKSVQKNQVCLRVFTNHAEKTAIHRFSRMIRAIRREDRTDAQRHPRPMTQTALHMLPSAEKTQDFAHGAYWALRAICRQELSPDKIQKLYYNLAEYSHTPIWPYLECAIVFLINQRDYLTLIEPPTSENAVNAISLNTLNEKFRCYIKKGDLRGAQIIEPDLCRLLDHHKNPIQQHAYQLRRARMEFDQGEVNEANIKLQSLREQLEGLEQKNFDNHLAYHYRTVATHLLWAMTELYAEIPAPSLMDVILKNLQTALENDFCDMVMMAVSLMGEQLMREKNFQEAHNLWHYLWQSSRYLEHYHMMVKACCGLSECALALDKKDKFILTYMDEVAPYVLNMPGIYSELLAARGTHHLLQKQFDLAKRDLDQADAIAQEQGLGLLRLKTSGLRMVIEGHEEDCLEFLFKEKKKLEHLQKNYTTFPDHRSLAKLVGGQRGFFRWKSHHTLELVTRYLKPY